MFLKAVANLADLPETTRPHVAMVGRSNVGKSSFVNAFAGQKDLARVSASPGRTQTINVYQLANTYYLLDLPGYGYAKHAANREKFATLITDYIEQTAHLALILLVIDARRGLTDLDTEMLNWILEIGKNVVLVVNKSDKLTHQETSVLSRTLATAYPTVPHFFHSIREEGNRGEIRAAIEKAIRNK